MLTCAFALNGVKNGQTDDGRTDQRTDSEFLGVGLKKIRICLVGTLYVSINFCRAGKIAVLHHFFHSAHWAESINGLCLCVITSTFPPKALLNQPGRM